MQTGIKRVRTGFLAKKMLFEVKECQAGRTAKEEELKHRMGGRYSLLLAG